MKGLNLNTEHLKPRDPGDPGDPDPDITRAPGAERVPDKVHSVSGAPRDATPAALTRNRTTNVERRAPALPLCRLRPGQIGIVAAEVVAGADASLLRAMGLRPGAWVRVCRVGEPCIVEILGAMGDNAPPCEPGCAEDPKAVDQSVPACAQVGLAPTPRGCGEVLCSCRVGLARHIGERLLVHPVATAN